MDQPKMDLPHTLSDGQYNTDSQKTKSKMSLPDGTLQESTDYTHPHSPNPLSEKKEPAQLINGIDSHVIETNGDLDKVGDISSQSETIVLEEDKPKKVLSSSQCNEKTETPELTTNKEIHSSHSYKNETDSFTSTREQSEDVNTLSNIKNSDVHDSSTSQTSDSRFPSENEDKVSQGNENSQGNSLEPQNTSETEDVVDILGNGLLKKKILKPGAGTDSRPTNGEVVTLKINGCLDDGTQVEDDQIIFTLNDGDVIVAFELAVALMEQGEKCELFSSSRYAYGELGRDPDIPKDANITYTLELIDVKPPVNVASLSCDERLNLGEQKRERGNYLFKRSDYSGAINSYNKAVKVLDDADLNAGLSDDDRNHLADCWTKCYNNMAACQLKIDALDAAIRSCEKVLSHQSDNIKALFRLGKAHGAKGEIDSAITSLKKAIKLDPESKMLHQEMLALTRRKNKETESEKMLYQRMLGVKSDGQASKSAEEKKSSSSVMKWTLALGAVTAAMVSIGLTWYRNS